VSIACNLCSKGFNFEGLPTDRPLFCPDCGSPATIIDTSELLERKKGNISAITSEIKSPPPAETNPTDPSKTEKTAPYTPSISNYVPVELKTDSLNQSEIKKTLPYTRPRYDRRIALVLTSLGVIGIVGVGHLYTKSSKGIKKGICFLIGGFFVYLITIVRLAVEFFSLSAEYTDPSGGGKFLAIFFLIVYILIWLWQFIDLRRLTKYAEQ
jgi:hypothetical protein